MVHFDAGMRVLITGDTGRLHHNGTGRVGVVLYQRSNGNVLVRVPEQGCDWYVAPQDLTTEYHDDVVP